MCENGSFMISLAQCPIGRKRKSISKANNKTNINRTESVAPIVGSQRSDLHIKHVLIEQARKKP